MIKCKICDRKFSILSALSNHIKIHNISSKDYYDQYMKKNGEGICNCGKHTTFRGLGGYSKYCSSGCVSKDPSIKLKKEKSYQSHYGASNVFQSKEFLDQQKIRKLEIRDNIINDRNLIKCKICGYLSPSLYGLSRHINRAHKISDKKYYDKYLYLDGDNKYCKICGIETRFYGFSIGYLIYCSKKCAWSDPEIKYKRKDTWLEKYGVSHPQKTEKSRNRNRKNQLTPHHRERHRLNLIKQIETQHLNGEPLMPCIGMMERECLNQLESSIQIPIIRNRKLNGFFPDGRIENTKILIEFDEPFHFDFDGNLKSSDVDRQNQLESKGYTLFRVSQKEWEENPPRIIKQFQQLVKELECQIKMN